MKRNQPLRTVVLAGCSVCLLFALTSAQEREDRTLLSPAEMRAIVNEVSGERAMHHLLGQKKTVLEIRDFLSGEFEPLRLADLTAVLRAREAAGVIRLVPKPAARPR